MPSSLLTPLRGHSRKESAGPPTSPTMNQENLDDVDEMDDQGQSIIMSIISQLRIGSDLSRITLPTFILERKSMLERITNQLQQPELLLDAKSTADPTERFLNVVKWYLAGWHIAPKAVKKPLNPVIGEHFACYWDLPNGTRAYYFAEQTSHHPPKSSYFFMSPDNHIRVDGTLVPQSKFLGNSAASIMEGMAFLQFLDILDKDEDPEKYEFTQPNMYVRGILIGTLKLELGDHAIVKCPQNDLIADIEFKTKGFISGTYNAIYGEIKQLSTGKVLYEITGKWNEVMEIKKAGSSSKEVFFDTSKSHILPPLVRPLSEQSEFESRNLWAKVTDALSTRNHELATDEKFAIEDRQRKEARKREEDNVEFHPKLFKPTKSPLEFIIYKDINGSTPEEQTKQILSIAPVLPGQQFHPEFEIPAFKKDQKNDESVVKKVEEPLNTIKDDFEKSLPGDEKD